MPPWPSGPGAWRETQGQKLRGCSHTLSVLVSHRLLWAVGRLRKLGERDAPCAAPRPALRVRRLLQADRGRAPKALRLWRSSAEVLPVEFHARAHGELGRANTRLQVREVQENISSSVPAQGGRGGGSGYCGRLKVAGVASQRTRASMGGRRTRRQQNGITRRQLERTAF